MALDMHNPSEDGAPLRAAALRGRALTICTLAASVLAGTLPLWIGGDPHWLYLWIDSAFGVAAFAAALRCYHTTAQLSGRERRAWFCFASGCLGYALGCVVWAAYEISGAYNPVPSPADLGLLSLPLLFLVGLWYAPGRATSIGVSLVQIGNLGIIISTIVFANVILFYEAFQHSGSPQAFWIFMIYDVLDTSAFLFGLISLSQYHWGRRRLPMALLLLGLFVLTVVDVVSSRGILGGEYTSLNPINGLYLLCFALFYCAACERERIGPQNAKSVVLPRLDARTKRWGTLLPPFAVATALVSLLLYQRTLSHACIPYAASAVVLFIVALGLRDWWEHRSEAELRSLALASERRLQESEKLLRDRNEQLAHANRDLWAEMKERVRIQDELRHSHKMEALGQLTGGVAHDFNNLLAVILGNIELLQHRVAADPTARELTDEAAAAADRGASLTQRLLAFSRKQQLEPSCVDVRALLDDMRGMLDRTLGAAIRIRMELPATLWPCMVDVAQLENAILNLAINARDAMPGGGELRIEAANEALDRVVSTPDPSAARGDHVRISVCDTGVGMSEEVRTKVFDPFFTTKSVGMGSGLGLSMVYGFVSQSGGNVSIRSEPGGGTQIDLYLPRADGMPRRAAPAADPVVAPGGGESILLVEDESAVRRLLMNTLREFGYVVTPVCDATQALAVLEDLDPLHLMLSDVVLPGGISGRELAREIARRRPEVKIVLMSGFASDVFAREGNHQGDVTLLRKPFRRTELAQKIRAALDAA
jgi:signal transduction histidine kinase/CheY-like chemotaxis protein